MTDFAFTLTALLLQPWQRNVGGGFWSGTFWTIFWIGFLILAIAAIIDCLNKCKPEDRLVWILIILFVPWVGPVLYFVLAPRGGTHQTTNDLRDRANSLKSRYQNPRKPSSRFTKR